MKITFNDSMQMERLHSVLDGDAIKAVSSTGTNSIFYAGALKALNVPQLASHPWAINPQYALLKI